MTRCQIEFHAGCAPCHEEATTTFDGTPACEGCRDEAEMAAADDQIAQTAFVQHFGWPDGRR